MVIEIRCLTCGESYECNQRNTSIIGPVIDTTCPECGELVRKNYSAFLDAQVSSDMRVGFYTTHIKKARIMITMAQAISKTISNEEAFVKRKK